jgi:hypothetical protein
MKRMFFMALTLGLLLVASPAMAAGFHLYGSYWNSSDLDDAAGGGVKLAIPLGSRAHLALRGTYYEPFDEDALRDEFDDVFDDVPGDPEVFPSELQVIPIEAGFGFNLTPDSPVNFVIEAGGTYFLLDLDGPGDLDDEFGWYGSVGLELARSGGLGFFVEGIYRSAEGTVENEDDLDEIDFNNDVPFELDGVAVNAGIVWRW